MKKFKISGSSLLGASLGWWTLGPVGAILGFVVGAFMDNASLDYTRGPAIGDSRDGFVAALLVLIAAVMKADGKIVRTELDYVKAYLRGSFSEEKATQALLMLRDILSKNIPLDQVARQIAQHLDYNSRIQLIHMLFGVANADGDIAKSEQEVIYRIALQLNITSVDYESLLHMYVKNTESSYKILEIDANATDDEVKKAFRKMAIKFHPDKVAHLGQEFQATANEKFKKVNEAYDSIKKQRGIK